MKLNKEMEFLKNTKSRNYGTNAFELGFLNLKIYILHGSYKITLLNKFRIGHI